MSSSVLVVVGISETATPGSLDQATLSRWIFIYAPTYVFLYMLAVTVVSRYKIDRQIHEENLRQLRAMESDNQ
jgi:hypothetical protein